MDHLLSRAVEVSHNQIFLLRLDQAMLSYVLGIQSTVRQRKVSLMLPKIKALRVTDSLNYVEDTKHF